jgi:hypothetical protein
VTLDEAQTLSLRLIYLAVRLNDSDPRDHNVKCRLDPTRCVAGLLFKKGYISDPKGKAKSVWLTDEGAGVSEALFREQLGLRNPYSTSIQA